MKRNHFKTRIHKKSQPQKIVDMQTLQVNIKLNYNKNKFKIEIILSALTI